MNSYHLILASLFSFFLFLPLPAFAEMPPEDAAVVVSIKPLHSLVAGVMGDSGKPSLVVSGDSSLHDFHLKPSQVRMLQNAKIVFYIDDDFETFLKSALAALPDAVRKSPLANQKGLNILKVRKGGVWENHPHDHDNHDNHNNHDNHANHDNQDNHLWLDPDNARLMVELIASELASVYPQNKSKYFANAKAVAERIAALDQRLKKELSASRGVPFIIFHDATQYFEQHYGLSAVGSITFEPDEAPSSQRIKKLREKIKESKVVCVFSEPYFSDKILTILREGNNVNSAILDPEATALAPDADLYFKLLENLASSFGKCLKRAA